MTQQSDKIVLVTGINGYLASNIGMAVLQRGYRLRGTVRAAERASQLMNGPWKEYASRIEIVEVPDICAENAFEEAVKGVSAILHTAAPVIKPTVKTSAELIIPTVRGTQNILRSAKEHAGAQLESFVFTSSAAACINPGQQAPHTYTDASWNEVHPATVEKEGDDASVYISYPVAKITAEKYVWSFRETEKPPFAITSICGSIATGPPLVLPESGADLPLTIAPVYKALIGKNEPGPQDFIAGIAGAAPYMDVRDLAKIYLFSFEQASVADGERYLAVAGHGPKQAIFDILRQGYPERWCTIYPGDQDHGYNKDWTFNEDGVRFDATKVKDAASIDWISYEKSIMDTARSLGPLIPAAA